MYFSWSANCWFKQKIQRFRVTLDGALKYIGGSLKCIGDALALSFMNIYAKLHPIHNISRLYIEKRNNLSGALV